MLPFQIHAQVVSKLPHLVTLRWPSNSSNNAPFASSPPLTSDYSLCCFINIYSWYVLKGTNTCLPAVNVRLSANSNISCTEKKLLRFPFQDIDGKFVIVMGRTLFCWRAVFRAKTIQLEEQPEAKKMLL